MVSGIAFVIAIMSTLPIITWLALLILCSLILRQKRMAFNVATDITTFFAVIASIMLCRHLWDHNYGGLAVLVILIIAFVYTLLFWKIRREFEFKKIFRGIWRTTFLTFMVSDFFLYLYGFINQFISFT